MEVGAGQFNQKSIDIKQEGNCKFTAVSKERGENWTDEFHNYQAKTT